MAIRTGKPIIPRAFAPIEDETTLRVDSLFFRRSREYNRIAVFKAKIHHLDNGSLRSQTISLDDNRSVRRVIFFEAMRKILELDLLIAIVDQRIRGRR